MTRQETLTALLLCQEQFGLAQTLHRFFGPGLRVRLCFSAAACRMDVAELQLSVRSHNALKRAGLFTLEAVVGAIADGSLEKTRTLGRKSLSEIKTVLMQTCFDRLTPKEREAFFLYILENNTPL